MNIPSVVNDAVRIILSQGSQTKCLESWVNSLDLASSREIFAPSLTQNILETHMNRNRPDNENEFVWKTNDSSFMPIETFKYAIKFFHQNVKPSRCFKSSGTTLQNRATSPFSNIGLQQYRKQALIAFYAMMRHFFTSPLEVAGISLIPTTQEWPDSSLAQMVEWISELSPLQYVKKDPKEQFLTNLQPTWVFGTAFHYVNLFDQGFRHPLPKGSIVIETGGTKGKSREISTKELYSLIETMFQVPESQIISEYGMCELAAQAYDFVENSDDNAKRAYRFPTWVQTKVEQANSIRLDGEGCLIIADPFRPDIDKPIRTQDLVSLYTDGTFSIQGRLPTSPIKGCSLHAEDPTIRQDVTKPPSQKQKTHVHHIDPANGQPHSVMLKRAQFIAHQFRNLFFTPKLNDYLLDFFGNHTTVKMATRDLELHWHSTAEKWVEAATNSCPTKSTKRKWLIIGPNSHPIAIIEPLIFGYILGLEITLRNTRTFTNFEKWIAAILNNHGGHIKTIKTDQKIGAGISDSASYEALMAFGQDSTISSILSKTNLPSQSFGSYETITVCRLHDLEQYGADFAKDFLSLNQLGCFSSRALVVITNQDEHLDHVGEKISQHLVPYIREWLDKSCSLERDTRRQVLASSKMHLPYKHEMIKSKLINLPILTFDYADIELFFPYHELTTETKLSHIVSPVPFVIPIVLCPSYNISLILQLCEKEPSLKRVISKTKPIDQDINLKVNIVPPGNSNVNLYDGTHDDRPYFVTSREL